MEVHRQMIDTVAGKFENGPYFPKDVSRNDWETRTRDFFDVRLGNRQRTVAHLFNRPEARIAILGDGGILRVEASLPKLIYGNNVSAVIDPRPALNLLREFIVSYVESPIQDLMEMEYLRVDYCHNFYVGAALRDYLSTLGNVSFLKHHRSTDGFGGVEWWGGNGRLVRAYDKYKEILETERKQVPEARGMLRFEIQLRKKSGFLQRRVKVKRPTFRDVLEPALGHHCLDETLTQMGLAHKFATRDSARQLLDEIYSYRKATRLLGVSRRLETETMDDLKSASARSTFYTDKRDLRRLGLWPPSTSANELPALQLPSLEQLLENEVAPDGSTNAEHFGS